MWKEKHKLCVSSTKQLQQIPKAEPQINSALGLSIQISTSHPHAEHLQQLWQQNWSNISYIYILYCTYIYNDDYDAAMAIMKTMLQPRGPWSKEHLKTIEVAIFHVHAGGVSCECLSANTHNTKKHTIPWPHNLILGCLPCICQVLHVSCLNKIDFSSAKIKSIWIWYVLTLKSLTGQRVI